MRFTTGFLCACALSLVVAMPATAQVHQRPSSSVALSTIRIDNFGRIDDTYYRGAQPKGRDYADLAALGVKTVIDLQADGDNADEAKLVAASGMRFYRIGMTPRVAPTAEQLAAFLRIVKDPAQQPVYVHCAGGRHRTGVMGAVYRFTHDHWNYDQVYAEMKTYDFYTRFGHGAMKQYVEDYWSQLQTASEGSKAATTKASN